MVLGRKLRRSLIASTCSYKKFSFLLAVLLVLAAISGVTSQASKTGSCPLPATVTRCMVRCKGDYDCSFNKKCCPNACGSTSCTESTSIPTGYDKYSTSVKYCSNVKCQPGEVCVLDKRTKREKCGRGY